MTPFSRDEILEIAASLEDYHRVFYTFFQLANVFYSESVKTAAIQFQPHSPPLLLINSEFWNRLNHRERLFVICHECLHVLLQHDIRNGMDIAGATFKLVNIAQDICINEMIVSLFQFNRDDIRDWKKYCWIDTCFDDPSKVKYNETFTYYLELLIKEQKKDLPDLIDDHPEASDGDGESSGQTDDDGELSEEIKEKIRETAEKLAEDLTKEEIERLAQQVPDSPIAGIAEGMMSIWAGGGKRAKVHFKKIIRHLKKSRVKYVEKDGESFVQQDRRYDDVIRHGKVSLPGKHGILKPSKDRLLTVLFMDISGSCVTYVPTFNKVYEAFDRERDVFEVRVFTFDIKTKEHKYGQRIIGGGGTRFHILEEKVQQLKAEYGKYPDCIVVISDGEGNVFHPQIPERWVWLLTPHPMYQYIHPRSKKFLISDVVL